MNKLLSLFRLSQVCRKIHTTPAIGTTIPMVIDSDDRIERVYDIYSRLLRDRIICLMSEVSIFNGAWSLILDF